MGIPAIQTWCRRLASDVRREPVQETLISIKELAMSIREYLTSTTTNNGIESERSRLRFAWTTYDEDSGKTVLEEALQKV